MLHAFKEHKISEKVRNELWNLEDAKTSSIIGTLSHLPAQMIWTIFYTALANKRNLPVPEEVHDLIDIEFWPCWKLENKVEPDVFLRFDSFDIIIEVKRNDYNIQYKDQWNREFAAYYQVYPDSQKPCYLIAISGKTLEQDKRVYPCSWTSLLNAVQLHLQEKSLHNPYAHETRILKDIITAFEIHREHPYLYFKSIAYEPEKDGIGIYNDLFIHIK